MVFNLDPTADGRLEVHDTERRLSDAVESLDRIIVSRCLSKKDALSLRGRLPFCDAFILADWVVFLFRILRIMLMLHLSGPS